MPTVKINGAINVSVQAGDILYSTRVDSGQSGSNHPNVGLNGPSKPEQIGIIDPLGVNYVANTITFTQGGGSPMFTPNQNTYLFAGKDNRVNTSGLLGYFAEVELVNHSTRAAEIFVVAADYVPSSK